MTNLQAIDLLKGLEQSLDDYCELNDEGKTAFGMAITALELFGNSEQFPSAQPEQRWIPVTERLPEEDGRYLITGKRGTVYSLEYEDGRWYGGIEPIAWMPLPAPYRKEGEQHG